MQGGGQQPFITVLLLLNAQSGLDGVSPHPDLVVSNSISVIGGSGGRQAE